MAGKVSPKDLKVGASYLWFDYVDNELKVGLVEKLSTTERGDIDIIIGNTPLLFDFTQSESNIFDEIHSTQNEDDSTII